VSERESAERETEREVAARPPRTFHNGPTAAAVLAAGVGCAVLGLFTLLSEAIEPIHNFMELSSAVGPLSGKTTFAVLVWLVVWGGLHLWWRNRNVSFRAVYIVTLVLVGVGFVLTFPPVFLAFSYE
jgi:fluoride ion exporter CrcB/FEX